MPRTLEPTCFEGFPILVRTLSSGLMFELTLEDAWHTPASTGSFDQPDAWMLRWRLYFFFEPMNICGANIRLVRPGMPFWKWGPDIAELLSATLFWQDWNGRAVGNGFRESWGASGVECSKVGLPRKHSQASCSAHTSLSNLSRLQEGLPHVCYPFLFALKALDFFVCPLQSTSAWSDLYST